MNVVPACYFEEERRKRQAGDVLPRNSISRLHLPPTRDVASTFRQSFTGETPIFRNRSWATALSLLFHAMGLFGLNWTNAVSHPSFSLSDARPMSVVLASQPREYAQHSLVEEASAHPEMPAAPVKREGKANPAPAQWESSRGNEKVAEAASNNPFGPWYYPSHYLHRHPSPLKPLHFEYPPNTMGLSGRVRLLLYIGFTGSIDKYEIVESEPKGMFDQSVIDAFTSAQFAPGQITGYPVRSQLLVEVTYDPGQEPRALLRDPPEVK